MHAAVYFKQLCPASETLIVINKPTERKEKKKERKKGRKNSFTINSYRDVKM